MGLVKIVQAFPDLGIFPKRFPRPPTSFKDIENSLKKVFWYFNPIAEVSNAFYVFVSFSTASSIEVLRGSCWYFTCLQKSQNEKKMSLTLCICLIKHIPIWLTLEEFSKEAPRKSDLFKYFEPGTKKSLESLIYFVLLI